MVLHQVATPFDQLPALRHQVAAAFNNLLDAIRHDSQSPSIGDDGRNGGVWMTPELPLCDNPTPAGKRHSAISTRKSHARIVSHFDANQPHSHSPLSRKVTAETQAVTCRSFNLEG